MHIHNPRFLLVHRHDGIFLIGSPVRLVGERILGNDLAVADRDQILERLRRLLLVQRLL